MCVCMEHKVEVCGDVVVGGFYFFVRACSCFLSKTAHPPVLFLWDVGEEDNFFCFLLQMYFTNCTYFIKPLLPYIQI